jgi:hypothetical protein
MPWLLPQWPHLCRQRAPDERGIEYLIYRFGKPALVFLLIPPVAEVDALFLEELGRDPRALRCRNPDALPSRSLGPLLVENPRFPNGVESAMSRPPDTANMGRTA